MHFMALLQASDQGCLCASALIARLLASALKLLFMPSMR